MIMWMRGRQLQLFITLDTKRRFLRPRACTERPMSNDACFTTSTCFGLYGAITALLGQGLRRDEVDLGRETWRLDESQQHHTAFAS